MTSGIEELFLQIVSSEQKARERKSMINEVKLKIRQCDSEIKDIEEDTARLCGQLELKTQQYNGLELQIKWETKHKVILEEQKQTLMNKCSELNEQINRMVADMDNQEQQFAKDVHQFNIDNDLLSNPIEKREASWKEEIVQLKEQQIKLEEDLRNYKQHQSDVEILSTQMVEQMVQVDEIRVQITELNKKLEAEKQELVKLQQEKDLVSKIHHTDPEFQRLQKELNSMKSNNLESICTSLQQELESLEQKKWQKQIRSTADKQHMTRNLSAKVKIKQDHKLPTSSTVVLSNYSKLS